MGRAEADELAAADAIVVCGPAAPYADLLARRAAGSTVILAGPDAGAADGTPVVAGVNGESAAAAASVLVSPHAGGILLAHLLHPLLAADGADRRRCGGRWGRWCSRCRCTTAPASTSSSPRPAAWWRCRRRRRRSSSGTASSPSTSTRRHGARAASPAELRAVLGAEGLEVAVHLLQGAVFHGVSALVHVTLGRRRRPGALRQQLATHPAVELYAPDEGAVEQLGPIDVPSSDRVLVGPVDHDPGEAADGDGSGYWLWAVMDNLTRGGALNVLAILEHVLPGA